MKKMFGIGLLAILVVALIAASSFLFSVHQSQQAIVLYFGKPARVVTDPGLHVRTPIAEDVVYYDARVLDLDPPEVEVQLIDKKRINVDAYMRYRIIDPLLFFQSVKTESGFQNTFSRVVQGALKRVIAKVSLGDLLSDKRDNIMADIRAGVDAAAPSYGIEIIDVRIGRTDLPAVISQNVYNRMRTEREREARELRAEGKEEAQKITARADREKVVLVADAKRKAEILRGEGEGERVTILADAYGRDPEFFDFYKSMQAYRNSLGGDSTTMVLTPDSDFFRFFGQETQK
ncbi:MAG: protease modulator HflC [Pseudomonadota bacterium]